MEKAHYPHALPFPLFGLRDFLPLFFLLFFSFCLFVGGVYLEVCSCLEGSKSRMSAWHEHVRKHVSLQICTIFETVPGDEIIGWTKSRAAEI